MVRHRRGTPLHHRFWACVPDRPPDGCWPWRGRVTPDGYGELSIGSREDVLVWKAHRLSWELRNGPVPVGMVMRHLCGTRACVNPDHLAPGSQTENVADTGAMGRVPNGWRHWKAILTEGAALEIRRAYANGAKRSDLAVAYRVTDQCVGDVLSGTNWGHATSGDELQDTIDHRASEWRVHRGSSHGGSKLTDEKVREMRARYAAGGVTFKSLARDYGVSSVRVADIVRRKAWKHLD